MYTRIPMAWLCAIVALLASCNESPPRETIPPVKAVNVILVVDLSDRLAETPGQAEKDKQAIHALLEEFQLRAKKAAYIGSKDELRLVVAPQPEVPTSTNDKLSIVMQAPIGTTPIGYPRFKNLRAQFENELDELYQEAVRSPFNGADLYTFFCTELRTKYMKPNFENRVIVLTDGYLLFEKQYAAKRQQGTFMTELQNMRNEKAKWKERFERKNLALRPCDNTQFSHTKVMLLETAPLFKGISVYEFDIIEHYWKTWFDAMGLPAQIEPHHAMIGSIREKIKEFINP